MSRRSRREAAELQAEIGRLQTEWNELARLLTDRDARLDVLSRQHAAACDRIVALTTTVCGLRTQLAATQRQVDDETGMDVPEIPAGAGGQDNRPDRDPARRTALRMLAHRPTQEDRDG